MQIDRQLLAIDSPARTCLRRARSVWNFQRGRSVPSSCLYASATSSQYCTVLHTCQPWNDHFLAHRIWTHDKVRSHESAAWIARQQGKRALGAAGSNGQQGMSRTLKSMEISSCDICELMRSSTLAAAPMAGVCKTLASWQPHSADEHIMRARAELSRELSCLHTKHHVCIWVRVTTAGRAQ